MLSDATATIQQSRHDRVAELTDAAHRELVVAQALEALVRVIHHAELPVAHYGPVWRHVETRLRADAREAHRRALQAAEHVDDVRQAIDARERVGR